MYPFNPSKVNLQKYPSSLPCGATRSNDPESPIHVTCTTCRKEDVSVHPLVRQGVIPKDLADVFVHQTPAGKSKSRTKVVKNARVITSEKVREEVRLVEERKKMKILVAKKDKRRNIKGKKTNTRKKSGGKESALNMRSCRETSTKRSLIFETDTESENEIKKSDKKKTRKGKTRKEPKSKFKSYVLGHTSDLESESETIQKTHPKKLDLDKVFIGDWVRVRYKNCLFLGLVIDKKFFDDTETNNVRVRCFEKPLESIKEPMELEKEGRAIWYLEVYEAEYAKNNVYNLKSCIPYPTC